MPSSWRLPPRAILGCGGTSSPDPSLTPQEAAVLSSKIDEIAANVQVGSCLVASDKTDDLIADIQELPSCVDSDVKTALNNGANQLRCCSPIRIQCQGHTTTPETTTEHALHDAGDHDRQDSTTTTTTRTQTQPTTTVNTSTQGTTIGNPLAGSDRDDRARAAPRAS